ncbi:hypothetical protein [Haemophilus influenzae]|uniref:hypothetical protein n=1 Tax=Haemophilus influenzae TaxID=727 RepID=UPI000DD3F43D|nr:hypothetical protein [Haemophilus influenzae]
MYIFSQNNVTRAKMSRAEFAAYSKDYKGKLDGEPSIMYPAYTGLLMVDFLTKKTALEQLSKVLTAGFISPQQAKCIKSLLNSEEQDFFIEAVDRIYSIMQVMPKILEQDGKGDNAIAYLHYFTANTDFYITEKDIEDEITQAFGLVSFVSDYPEIGYISIEEVIKAEAEIDLHFEPKTLGEIKQGL